MANSAKAKQCATPVILRKLVTARQAAIQWTAEPMDLRGYERRKFELSEILQSAAALTTNAQTQDQQDRFRDLFIRLAEDRFNLVLAGRFNRGKSSLMNALLGMDRLPTGLVPLTSVVTTVTYGSSEQVTLRYRERRLDNLIPLKELPQYVTEEGNPRNNLGIATATIELPAEILRRGFYFVDTPGLGSVIAESTRTTRAFMPEADALLLVTSFESPLSEDELDFFSAAIHSRLPAFVVVNKHDLVTQAERDQAIAFIKLHLSKFHSETRAEILSVSARDGLEAKLSRDEALLHASGLPILEDRLIQFLLEQKRTVFLSRMCNRVDELIRQLPQTEHVTSLCQRLGAFSASLQISHGSGDAVSSDHDFAPTFNRNLLKPCQICSAVENETWDFIARYQYELSINRKAQADFALRSGFCCYHTWEYQAVTSSFGVCSGYPALLERLAGILTEAERTPAAGNLAPDLRDVLPTQDKCVVCALRERAEAEALADLVANLEKNGLQALAGLSALCLPHLCAVNGAIGDPELSRSLIRQHKHLFERTAEDMRRFTLKQSAGRRHLESREEEVAAQRALLLLAGIRAANHGFGAKSTHHGCGMENGKDTGSKGAANE